MIEKATVALFAEIGFNTSDLPYFPYVINDLAVRLENIE